MQNFHRMVVLTPYNKGGNTLCNFIIQLINFYLWNKWMWYEINSNHHSIVLSLLNEWTFKPIFMFCIWQKDDWHDLKKNFFLYFSSALQDSISKTCTYKTNSAALYIILSIKVILYSFILNTENALILPSRVIFLMLSFTAGQHSPTCVGAINFKTQESSKEEDQRIHSFVLEILWGCHKIRTCTLFSLWHFFVHLEELCMLVHHRISRHFYSVRHHLRRYFCFFLI